MKHTKTFALWLAICAMALAACANPSPNFSGNPTVNRHLQSGSRDYLAGRLREARASFQAAVIAAEKLDNSADLVDAWMAKAATELLQEDYAAAAKSYTQAHIEAQSVGLMQRTWQTQVALADIDRRVGHIAAARTRFEHLRSQLPVGNPDLVKLDQGLALCALAEKEPERSLALLRPWVAQAPDMPPQMRAALLANMARVQLALGYANVALNLAQDALALDQQLEHPPAIAADHLLLASVLHQMDRAADARLHQVKAQRIRLSMGLPEAGLASR
jgi:tetratricopeptide (TPR) repeat protein